MNNTLANNCMRKCVQRELHESKDSCNAKRFGKPFKTCREHMFGILGNNLSNADDTVTDPLEIW